MSYIVYICLYTWPKHVLYCTLCIWHIHYIQVYTPYTYLLLAECEVCTASYGPSFFLPFMAQVRGPWKQGRKKRGSITCHTDQANEANKMFIIWLCWLFRFWKGDRELEVRTATYRPGIDQSQHAKSVSHIINEDTDMYPCVYGIYTIYRYIHHIHTAHCTDLSLLYMAYTLYTGIYTIYTLSTTLTCLSCIWHIHYIQVYTPYTHCPLHWLVSPVYGIWCIYLYIVYKSILIETLRQPRH